MTRSSLPRDLCSIVFESCQAPILIANPIQTLLISFFIARIRSPSSGLSSSASARSQPRRLLHDSPSSPLVLHHRHSSKPSPCSAPPRPDEAPPPSFVACRLRVKPPRSFFFSAAGPLLFIRCRAQPRVLHHRLLLRNKASPRPEDQAFMASSCLRPSSSPSRRNRARPPLLRGLRRSRRRPQPSLNQAVNPLLLPRVHLLRCVSGSTLRRRPSTLVTTGAVGIISRSGEKKHRAQQWLLSFYLQNQSPKL